MKTIRQVTADLATRRASAVSLVEQAFAAIDDVSGEGRRTFISTYPEKARSVAAASDAMREAGVPPLPLAGVPISIKDLFDVAGEVTRAGSKVREDSAVAGTDAPIVARLRAAGAILVGRTNMTEFAFSGLGINPHYGTPRNPWDRRSGRIPGGSSSGAGVSVTDGMAVAAVGTDTGGSVRIPSALCGLSGFKPTARRVSTQGAFPLSTSLDSIGPLAASVSCCALIDQVISGKEIRPLIARPVSTLTLGVPQTIVLDDMDQTVAETFEVALSKLSAAGARIVDIPFDALSEIPKANATGGFAASEAYAILRDLLEACEDRFDPRVSVRVKRGADMSAADYHDLISARVAIRTRADAQTRDFDAVLMPTVPKVAPVLSKLITSDEAYQETNMLMLRNSSFGNFLDRCAASLPVHEKGSAPVGLMVMGETMGDTKTLEVAAGIETALSE